jgi:hypothetical protein
MDHRYSDAMIRARTGRASIVVVAVLCALATVFVVGVAMASPAPRTRATDAGSRPAVGLTAAATPAATSRSVASPIAAAAGDDAAPPPSTGDSSTGSFTGGAPVAGTHAAPPSAPVVPPAPLPTAVLPPSIAEFDLAAGCNGGGLSVLATVAAIPTTTMRGIAIQFTVDAAREGDMVVSGSNPYSATGEAPITSGPHHIQAILTASDADGAARIDVRDVDLTC